MGCTPSIVNTAKVNKYTETNSISSHKNKKIQLVTELKEELQITTMDLVHERIARLDMEKKYKQKLTKINSSKAKLWKKFIDIKYPHMKKTRN